MSRILITEDESPIQDLCRTVLRHDGHEVTLRSDGREGLEFLRTNPVDLLLTDLRMPFGGFSFIPQVHAEFPDVRIVVMSGNGPEDLDTALHLGANAVIAKPFTVARLRLTIHNLLRIPAAVPVPRSA